MPVGFQRDVDAARAANVPNLERSHFSSSRSGTVSAAAANQATLARALLFRWEMNGDDRVEVDLDQGEAHLLRDLVPGRVLYVLSGMAWVTQENDSRDHLLGPGGLFRVQIPGRVVVEALKRTRLL